MCAFTFNFSTTVNLFVTVNITRSKINFEFNKGVGITMKNKETSSLLHI